VTEREPKREDGVTICIPNWNHRSYLARSVGSARTTAARLATHGVGCQILVVDDHSRDGSQRLLFSLCCADESGALDVILKPRNEGLAAARNTGLDRAKYRWVCVLDADNELMPDNLFHFYRAARDTGAALTYGNLLVKREGQVTGLASNDVVTERILDGNYIDALSIVDSVRVLALGGYTDHPYARTHEDWELILHLIAENELLIFVPMVLGIYHVENGSMLQTVQLDHSKIYRMFNQRRTGFPPGFSGGRLYHPDIGFLI
jgi:glycosyltransferase involved in cell wall biosynthesis